jgi:hypothetical protein
MIKHYKTFDLSIPKDVHKILVSFSGGSDSLLSLYSICDYIQHFDLDIQVSCVHGLDTKDCPESLHNVELMLHKIRKIFNMPIDLQVFEYQGVEQKVQIHSDNIRKIIKDQDYDMIVYGSSANPPRDIMIELYSDHKGKNAKRLYRDLDVRKKEKTLNPENYNGKNYYNYRPLLLLNKKEIAAASREFQNLWNMQTLTRSCDYTKNGLPCKKCYSCSEKMWAFGYYDGKIQ